MTPYEALATLAQVAVALAGFSSVIVAFRRGGSEAAWLPEDAFRFRIMLQFSLVAGFFAALPIALSSFAADGTIWPALDLALMGFVLAIFASVTRQSRGLARALNPVIFRLNFALVAAICVLLALGGAGFVRAAAAYLAAVGFLVAESGLMFYRLVTAPISDSR